MDRVKTGAKRPVHRGHPRAWKLANGRHGLNRVGRNDNEAGERTGNYYQVPRLNSWVFFIGSLLRLNHVGRNHQNFVVAGGNHHQVARFDLRIYHIKWAIPRELANGDQLMVVESAERLGQTAHRIPQAYGRPAQERSRQRWTQSALLYRA